MASQGDDNPKPLTTDEFFKLDMVGLAQYFGPVWPPLFMAYLHYDNNLMGQQKDQAVLMQTNLHKEYRDKRYFDHEGAVFYYKPLTSGKKDLFTLKNARKNFFKKVHSVVVPAYKAIQAKARGIFIPSFLVFDVNKCTTPGFKSFTVDTCPATVNRDNVLQYLRKVPGYSTDRDYSKVWDAEIASLDDTPEEVVEKFVESIDPATGEKVAIKKLVEKVSIDDFPDVSVPDVSDVEAEPVPEVSAKYADLLALLKSASDNPPDGFGPADVVTAREAIKLLEATPPTEEVPEPKEAVGDTIEFLFKNGVFLDDGKLIKKGVMDEILMTKVVRIKLDEGGKLSARLVNFIVKHSSYKVEEIESLPKTCPYYVEYLNPKMYVSDLFKVIKAAVSKRLKEPEKKKETEKKDGEPGSTSVTAVTLYSTNDMLDFSPSMLSGRTPDAAVSGILDGFIMRRIELTEWGFPVEKFGLTKLGILSQVLLDDGDVTSKKDIVFAGLLQYLVHAGLLTGVKEGKVTLKETETDTSDPPVTRPNPMLAAFTDAMLEIIKGTVGIIMVAIMYAYCQGIDDRNLRWYESFAAVYGKFISEQKMVQICKAVHSCGTIGKIMDCITLGDVYSHNKVFSYRLMRLSTPDLIKKALMYVPPWLIIEEFDAVALAAYRRFEQGGVPAQIAAGPLSQFCVGKVNPLKVKNIPNSLKLSELESIPDAPYDEDTIRKAKIILDQYKYNYGAWFQGRRASNNVSASDTRFKALVRRVHEIQSDVGEIEGMKKEEIAEMMATGRKEASAATASVIRGWIK